MRFFWPERHIQTLAHIHWLLCCLRHEKSISLTPNNWFWFMLQHFVLLAHENRGTNTRIRPSDVLTSNEKYFKCKLSLFCFVLCAELCCYGWFEHWCCGKWKVQLLPIFSVDVLLITRLSNLFIESKCVRNGSSYSISTSSNNSAIITW